MAQDDKPKRRGGRPAKEVPNLGTSPEKIARAMFSALKPFDPTNRKQRRQLGAGQSGVYSPAAQPIYGRPYEGEVTCETRLSVL